MEHTCPFRLCSLPSWESEAGSADGSERAANPKSLRQSAVLMGNIKFHTGLHTGPIGNIYIGNYIYGHICVYMAHFAHIRLSFGCTDEQIDFRLYLHNFGIFLNFPNLKIRNLKYCNVPGNVFRMSKSPDVGNN